MGFPIARRIISRVRIQIQYPAKGYSEDIMAARVFRKTTSYRFLESLMLSPKPFLLCRNAPDHATIQRDVYRIDISTLQQLVNF